MFFVLCLKLLETYQDFFTKSVDNVDTFVKLRRDGLNILYEIEKMK